MDTLTLNTTVLYGDVDRTESLRLAALFKLLQEAAIAHANRFGTGTEGLAARGETWVLNRIAVTVDRYPRYGESLRVETWSRGIRGFRGLRDARVFDASGARVGAASSLWIYVHAQTKAVTRVPKALAVAFPVGTGEGHCAELEALEFPLPAAASPSLAITLRYSDVDVHEHVNNAAYLDLLQTALVRAGRSPQPRSVTLKFGRPIPADAEIAVVRIGGGRPVVFSIEHQDAVCAQGFVTWDA